MADSIEQMIIYLKLSRAYRLQSRLSDRDRALMLAGINAEILQLSPVAALCRQLILQNNPGHILRKYPSFAEAMEDEDFQFFANQVAKKIPVEKVKILLAELDFSDELKQNQFANVSEYAAAILGVDLGWIKENFS